MPKLKFSACRVVEESRANAREGQEDHEARLRDPEEQGSNASAEAANSDAHSRAEPPEESEHDVILMVH